MIVATDDDTEVDVYYTDDIVEVEDEHVMLNKHEIFTKDAWWITEQPELDFTGTRVMANKPITVYSGNGQAFLHAPVSVLMNE